MCMGPIFGQTESGVASARTKYQRGRKVPGARYFMKNSLSRLLARRAANSEGLGVVVGGGSGVGGEAGVLVWERVVGPLGCISWIVGNGEL